MEQQIIREYDIEVQEIKLLRHNENMTYHVLAANGEYVLRIHKSIETMNLSMLIGESNPVELIEEEMNLLDILQKNSMGTQRPVRNKQGQFVTKLGDTYATLLEWVSGTCIQKQNMNEEIAFQIGSTVAKMHQCLAEHKITNRYSYGADLVKRMQQVYDTVLFSDKIEKDFLQIIRQMLDKIMDVLEQKSEEMLQVHNDLGESNLLLCENGVVPIDFSMSGSCIKEMDLASLFIHFEDVKLKEAILKGYKSTTGLVLQEELIDVCIGYQLLIFIFSQYQVICNQGWFNEALHYWCAEVFEKILEGKKIADEIGLYN